MWGYRSKSQLAPASSTSNREALKVYPFLSFALKMARRSDCWTGLTETLDGVISARSWRALGLNGREEKSLGFLVRLLTRSQ